MSDLANHEPRDNNQLPNRFAERLPGTLEERAKLLQRWGQTREIVLALLSDKLKLNAGDGAKLQSTGDPNNPLMSVHVFRSDLEHFSHDPRPDQPTLRPAEQVALYMSTRHDEHGRPYKHVIIQDSSILGGSGRPFSVVEFREDQFGPTSMKHEGLEDFIDLPNIDRELDADQLNPIFAAMLAANETVEKLRPYIFTPDQNAA